MTSTEQSYVTAPHRATCVEIPFWTLWPDMQVLLYQFAEETLHDRGDDVENYDLDGSMLRTARIPIAKYVAQMRQDMEEGHLEWDERGPAHVQEFMPVLSAGEYVPPIIVDKNGWLDGRHRMFAAAGIGLDTLPGIDYDEWLNSLVRKHKH